MLLDERTGCGENREQRLVRLFWLFFRRSVFLDTLQLVSEAASARQVSISSAFKFGKRFSSYLSGASKRVPSAHHSLKWFALHPMLFAPGRAGLPCIFKNWNREQRESTSGWDQHAPLRSEEEQKNRLTSSKYCYRQRILMGIMKSTRILPSLFFCDRFQEIVFCWRFLRIWAGFSFSLL